jgi:PadR family transcriptional regulator PadR
MNPENEERIATKWLREAQKGYIRIALLILLSKKPHYGYEMMKEVEDRTEGFWKPTAGGVYPILQSLEKAGYIEGEWGNQKRKRKSYRITEAGKLILDRALFKHNQIAESMNTLFEEYTRDVLDLEPNAVTVPQMPNPFSVFLEELPKNKIRALEIKRNRLNHMIKMLQSDLRKIESQLSNSNKKKKYENEEGENVKESF